MYLSRMYLYSITCTYTCKVSGLANPYTACLFINILMTLCRYAFAYRQGGLDVSVWFLLVEIPPHCRIDRGV